MLDCGGRDDDLGEELTGFGDCPAVGAVLVHSSSGHSRTLASFNRRAAEPTCRVAADSDEVRRIPRIGRSGPVMPSTCYYEFSSNRWVA